VPQERSGQQGEVSARSDDAARLSAGLLDPTVIVLAEEAQDVAHRTDRPLLLTLLGDAEPCREVRKHDQALRDSTDLHGGHRQPGQERCHVAVDRHQAIPGYRVVGREHLAAAVALLDSGRVTPASYLSPGVFHALNLLEAGALDDASAAVETARNRVEQGGTLADFPTVSGAAAGIHFAAGRWDDALAELEAGLEVMNDTGNFSLVLYYQALLAQIAIHRGDLARAEECLSVGAQRFADGVALFGADLLFGTQAEFLAANGELEAALTLAEMTWVQTGPTRYFYGHRARGTFLVRHALAAGRTELASAVTAELEEGARRSPATSAAAAGRLCRGLVEHDPDVLLEAVAQYRETPLRPDLAAACEDAAGLLAAANRRDEAVTLLHEVATIHDETDAAADAARVEAALRDLGVRGMRRRASRPSFGWESLTPMETTVSQLVAEGLTNPEIDERLDISRRTVETHLSHVFTKLGFASRTQLATELTRRATTS
jgi:DNA-binding CsgD family transcriptional regulator